MKQEAFVSVSAGLAHQFHEILLVEFDSLQKSSMDVENHRFLKRNMEKRLQQVTN